MKNLAIEILLENRIIEHQEALEKMPRVEVKSVQKRLEAMGKAMLVMEMENMHKGAIQELQELQKLIREL